MLCRRMSFFNVRRVEVAGVRYRDAARLVAALELPETSSVFDDLEPLEEKLRQQGGMEKVEVARRLPGTLVVRVTEADPVALSESPRGLIPVDRMGRPLPYDPAAHPIDVPVVGRPVPRLTEALAQVSRIGGELYAMAATAWISGTAVTLDTGDGLIRLASPVREADVQAVLAVRRDLAARAAGWREIDARFEGWIVVRQ